MVALPRLGPKNVQRFWHSLPDVFMLLAVCCAVYVLTASGHFSSTDEEDLYANTEILARGYANILYNTASIEEDQAPAQRAPQEIGQSIIALPWYWLGAAVSESVHPQWKAYTHRAIITTFNLFITLLTLTALYRWARQIFTHTVAMFLCGLYGLGTLAWPYSHTFYREPLVGLCLLLGFWSAAKFRTSFRRSDFLVAAAAIILAVATKFTAVIALPFWLLSLLNLDQMKFNRWTAWILVALSSAVLISLVTLPAKFETLLHYWQEVTFDTRTNRSAFLSYGLYGLTLSTGKGLFLYAPPILLSVLGFPHFFKLRRQDAVAIGGLFLAFLAVYSTRRGWHGGACWGPRYMLPVLPLMMLSAGAFLSQYVGKHLGRKTWRVWAPQLLIATVFIVGFAVQIAAVSVFPLNYYYIKAQEGVFSESSWRGGPDYLREVYFDPAHAPVLGHVELMRQRISHLIKTGMGERIGVLPANAHDLWLYMITLDRLDFWWLHLLLQPDLSVTPDPRLGVVTAPSDLEWLALARNGGMQWNRWQINWRDVESSPGVYDFTIPDRELALFQAAGIDVSVLLTYPPDWALRPGTLVPANLDDDASSPSQWTQFVYAVVEHYPEIRYWEIWNEPDMEMFWGGTVEDYFKLLRSGYQSVKQANPNAVVLMSGLAYWSDPAFFEELLELIASDPLAAQYNYYFDISAWHWYGRSSDLYGKVIWARDVMAKHGLEKPIWINEMNVALTPMHWQTYEEIQWTASPQEQAAFMVQGYANAMAAGVEKVFVFRLDDANMGTKWGVIQNDQTPRPSYLALQAVAEFLSDKTARVRTENNGIIRVIFDDADGNETWVVWNQQPSAQQITVPVDSSVLEVGLPDRSIQRISVEDGIATLMLPPATANYGNDEHDYFIGSMPIFLFFEAPHTQ